MKKYTLRSCTLITATFAVVSAAIAQPEYDCLVIEAFQISYPRRTSTINDISDAGHAIGWATDTSQVFSTSAFSWSPDADKVRLPDSQIDRAINSLGVAAGAMLVYSPSTNTTRIIPGVDAQHGRMRATGINDSTTVVGYAEVSAGSNSDDMSQVGFWWDPATGTHPVPVPEAKELLRINSDGLAVGNIRRIPGGMREAFTYDIHTGQSINLGMLLPAQAASRPYSIAADIAENGLVAGNLLVFNGTVNAMTAFTWSAAAGFTVQDVLTGSECYFMAQGVNSAGSVVGYTRLPANDVSPNTAVIWDAQRGVRNLNTLADLPLGLVLRRAVKINESGWIAAQGYFAAEPNYSRAVILRPRATSCPADFNQDGGVDGQDVEAFFLAWEAGDNRADVNQDGGVDGADVEMFFVHWQAGGC